MDNRRKQKLAYQSKLLQSGFTLIEVAIVIAISGLILFSIFKALALYSEEVALQKTKENIDILEASLSRYFQIYGRYPCPAKINDVVGDLNYGEETCDPGDLVAGTNLGNDIRNGNPVGDPDDTILVGMIPFNTIERCLLNDLSECASRDMYLSEETAYDGYGNRITYVVSSALTSSLTYSDNGGVIEIQDENRQSVLENPYSAHFVLISHGQNGRGAFGRRGERIQDNCVSSIIAGVDTPFPVSPTIQNEVENCDHNEGIYVSALRNETDPDTAYYDDIISYRLVELSALWERTGLSEIVNKNLGGVGVGDFDDANPTQAPLHVKGDMQSIDLYADRLCNQDSSLCVRPEFFGGEAENGSGGLDYINTCSNVNEAIVKIADNKVSCMTVYSGPIKAGQCAKDNPATPGVNEYEVMTAYSNQTGIRCCLFSDLATCRDLN